MGEMEACGITGGHSGRVPFALGISEIEHLEDMDVSFQEIGGLKGVAIMKRGVGNGPTKGRCEKDVGRDEVRSFPCVHNGRLARHERAAPPQWGSAV